MSPKRIVIHPGFHKSGTTALQESLAANREALKSYNVVYPDFGNIAHHRLAWSLTQKPWGWRDRGGERVPEKYWVQRTKELVAAKEETVVISSEFFSELDGEKIRRVRSDLEGNDVEILFTLRPLAKLLPSTYQQYLKYGTVAEYNEWLHSILDKPGESKINPTFWKRHSHSKVIARWADIFGASKITVLIVNEAEPTFLFDEINRYLGLPPKTLQAQATGSNRSLTMEEIALLLELNRRFPKERSWDEYEIFIRSGYIRELTDYVPAAPDKAKLLTPEWAVTKANEIGSKIKVDLETSKINIVGDLESLGNSKVPTGDSTYPTTIDINTVAAAMLTFSRETVRRLPIDWVRSSLLGRMRKRLSQALRRFR